MLRCSPAVAETAGPSPRCCAWQPQTEVSGDRRARKALGKRPCFDANHALCPRGYPGGRPSSHADSGPPVRAAACERDPAQRPGDGSEATPSRSTRTVRVIHHLPVPAVGQPVRHGPANRDWGVARSSPLDREILGLVGPAFVSTLLEPMQALLDIACVGQLGTESLAAVGLGTLLFTFGISFFTVLQVVTTTTVAGHWAQGQHTQASLATAEALWLALFCGVGLTTGLMFFAPSLVTLLGGQGAVHGMACTYVQTRAWACPGVLLYLAATGTCDMHRLHQSRLRLCCTNGLHM